MLFVLRLFACCSVSLVTATQTFAGVQTTSFGSIGLIGGSSEVQMNDSASRSTQLNSLGLSQKTPLTTAGFTVSYGLMIPAGKALKLRLAAEGQFESVLNYTRGRASSIAGILGLNRGPWTIDLGLQPFATTYWQQTRSEVRVDPGWGASLRIARQLNWGETWNPLWLTVSYVGRFYRQVQSGSLPEVETEITESGFRLGLTLELGSHRASTAE